MVNELDKRTFDLIITVKMMILDLPVSRPSAEVVARARGFLESAYTKFIKLTVFSNLPNAGLGGVPGNYHLVR